MGKITFEKIIESVQEKTEDTAFSNSHEFDDIDACEVFSEIVKVKKSRPTKGGTASLIIEKNGKDLAILTDKKEEYFDEINGKMAYISGVKKIGQEEKWYIRACRNVNDLEESFVKSEKLSIPEKMEFQKSIAKFSPEMQRDLSKKKLELSDVQAIKEDDVKVVYKNIEEIDAYYSVIKSVIPSEFRVVFEDARNRIEKNCSNSEKRNYQKQMMEILDIDWLSNAKYQKIDIEEVKSKISKKFVGYETQLEEIIIELQAYNLVKITPKAINFVGKKSTNVKGLAEELAKAMGRGYSVIKLNGEKCHESDKYTGSSQVYENAKSGSIYAALREAGLRGIIVIEDYDLCDSETRSIMQPILEKSTFCDEMVGVEMNLSELFVFVTCNSIEDIPLRERTLTKELFFGDMAENDIIKMINQNIVPKYCEQFELKFQKEIPKEICKRIIYRYSNKDINKIDSCIRNIAIKARVSGKKHFPDYTKENMTEFDLSKEEYEKIYLQYVRDISSLQHKFYTCFDEYPACVQEKITDLLDFIDNSNDSLKKEDARECASHLINIFEKKKHPFDLEKVTKELTKEHYLDAEVVEKIVAELLSKSLENKKSQMTIFGFKGNPGTGKTSLAKNIANALGTNMIKVPVGGAGGSEIIKGSVRTVSHFIKELSKTGHGTYSDVILLDEVDKGSEDFFNALYDFMDPNEEYLFMKNPEVRIPKNDFVLVLTFNDISRIPLPIRDRMQVIEFNNYSIEDKKIIIQRYILPRLQEKYAIEELTMEQDALDLYTSEYDIMAGMRDAHRDLKKILMKIALKNNGSFRNKVNITLDNVVDALGVTRSTWVNDIPPLSVGKCGTAQALAVTSIGIGITTCVETVINPTQTEAYKTTGLLEGSCLESVSVAHCFITNFLKEKFKDKELPKLHIHMTGASKKDGPSAGVAITMSMLSCLLDKPLPNVAFTGTVDLYGKIGSVDGCFPKTIAAERANIQTVYIPTADHEALERTGQLKRLNVEVVPVDTIEELINIIWEEKEV